MMASHPIPPGVKCEKPPPWSVPLPSHIFRRESLSKPCLERCVSHTRAFGFKKRNCYVTRAEIGTWFQPFEFQNSGKWWIGVPDVLSSGSKPSMALGDIPMLDYNSLPATPRHLRRATICGFCFLLRIKHPNLMVWIPTFEGLHVFVHSSVVALQYIVHQSQEPDSGCWNTPPILPDHSSTWKFPARHGLPPVIIHF